MKLMRFDEEGKTMNTNIKIRSSIKDLLFDTQYPCFEGSDWDKIGINVDTSYMEATEASDCILGLDDNILIDWKTRTDYTGAYLSYYVNYFMLRLVDGYLQEGDY